jgi:hypothetical protein
MKKVQARCKPLISFLALLVTAFMAGCGGDGGSTQPGVLSVSLTDAPACGFDQVNVTVSKVRVHQSDNASENAGGWTDITLDPPRKINLLDLNDPTQPNFALDNLGETPLEAGHYTQLRLVLDRNTGQALANSVVLSGTTDEIALDTPSGIQSGIKLIHQFSVDPGQRVDLLLDFDACKSVVKTGNGKYKLQPVIKVIPYALNGIEGFVDEQSFVNQSLVGKNVIASAQFNGEIVRAAVVNTVNGKFFIAHLDPANDYDVVITADDHAAAVITGVPVSPAPSITAISTEAEPIPLNSSTTHSIGGTVTLDPATDEAAVFIAAKQALDGGPTVTVKSQVASVKTDPPATTGDYEYNLALPIAAPSLGQYSTPLPIALDDAPQAAVAGQYAVEASATGYVTQSFNKDISAADATQDFALTQTP